MKGAAVLQGISATTRLKATLVKGTVVVATQRASSTDGVEKLMIAYPESAAGGWASALHFEALFVDKKSDEEDKVAADPVLRAQALAYRELQREAAKRDVDARGDPTYGMPLTTTDVTPFLPGRFGDLGSKVSMLHVHASKATRHASNRSCSATAKRANLVLRLISCPAAGRRSTAPPREGTSIRWTRWCATALTPSSTRATLLPRLRAFIIAAQKSQLHAVRRLLHLKVNVNARTLRSGETRSTQGMF